MGHSFRERNHSEEKAVLPEISTNAVARMETCEDVGELARESGATEVPLQVAQEAGDG